MRRVLAILLLVSAVLALTLLGQYRADPSTFFADPLQRLYEATQLFFMNGDWTGDLPRRPIEIELARFVAPLVALGSLILLLARGAWVGLTNFRARFARGHVVLVGLNALGWHFARSCRHGGLRAVAIERDESNPYVDRCRRMGVPVIVGEALSWSVLRHAGVARAAYLATFMSDDGTNVELTLQAKALIRRIAADREAPLKVRCRLSDAQLADRLQQYPKFFMDPHLAEISFFDTHGLAARTMLEKQPPEVFADVLRAPDVHVVIFGATPLAEQVLLHVARMGHYANFAPPRITICTEKVDAFRTRIEGLYPALERTARIVYRDTARHESLDEAEQRVPELDATMFVVCGENDSAGLSQALAIRRAALLGRVPNAPVMVAMERSDGLASLLESSDGHPEIPDGLYPFGMLDEIVSAAYIVDERLDRLAQAVHESYLDASVHSDDRRLARRPWRELSQIYREASRLQADHLGAKLRAAGCTEVAGREPFAFSHDELERLAQMERRRFLAVRHTTGWHAGEARSDFARIDSDAYMAPWESASASVRALDIEPVTNIPKIMNARLARCVRREIVIGVSGHRLNRLTSELGRVRAAVEATLDHIASLYPGAAFVVMSPLAEGADRLIARIAMTRLGARLYVPLPLPYDVYVQDFGDSAALNRAQSTAEFHDLIGLAERYFELPLAFGSVVELQRADAVGASARARQYALAGAYVVQRSHELIALWDGEPHEGEGGTAQVVGWRSAGVPAEYRFPNVFFPPIEPKAPFLIPVPTPEAFQPARYVAQPDANGVGELDRGQARSH